jgi:hypothetical protein
MEAELDYSSGHMYDLKSAEPGKPVKGRHHFEWRIVLKISLLSPRKRLRVSLENRLVTDVCVSGFDCLIGWLTQAQPKVE